MTRIAIINYIKHHPDVTDSEIIKFYRDNKSGDTMRMKCKKLGVSYNRVKDYKSKSKSTVDEAIAHIMELNTKREERIKRELECY